MAAKPKVIDVHCHPWFRDPVGKKIAKEAGINFSMKGLLEDFRKNNVVKAILISDDNKVLVDTVKKYPKLFIGAPIVHPPKAQKDLKEIKAGIGAGYFGAIKILPGYFNFYPSDKVYCPFYKLAAKHNIPVIIHTGDTLKGEKGRLKYARPIHVDDAAVDFQDVNFILCHMGCPWFMEAAEVAYKNPNVWTDISGIVTHELNDTDKKYIVYRLSEAINYVGPEKVLFGTDYPLISHKELLDFTRMLDVTKSELRQILHTNASKLLK
ncbi:MAG: amidohydrolase family protein [Candidatus Aenigmatarchaeota archaeon]